MSFDKFAWLKAVRDDEKLSDGEKYVLQNVALWYLRNGADVVHVRQATAADLLKVSIRLVQKAYAAARRLGYFTVQAGRERGRVGKSDSYRLAIPVPAQCAPTTTESTRTDCPKYPHETTKVPARAEAPTSADDTPIRVLKGFKEGAAPARQCSRHVNNPNPPACHPCRRAREDAEAWDKQQTERQQRETAAIRAAIDDCPDCDSAGRLDDLTDCPKHPNFRKASAA